MLLNQELNLSWPDAFHVMDEAERSGLNFIAEGEGLCLSAPEQHIVASVGWKKLGAFAAFLISTGEAAERMKKSIRKAMASFRYRSEEAVTADLSGEKARGIRYLYDVRDTGMLGESYVIRYRKTLYYFNFYTRAALKEENQDLRNGILASVRWEQNPS